MRSSVSCEQTQLILTRENHKNPVPNHEVHTQYTSCYKSGHLAHLGTHHRSRLEFKIEVHVATAVHIPRMRSVYLVTRCTLLCICSASKQKVAGKVSDHNSIQQASRPVSRSSGAAKVIARLIDA